MIEGLINVMTPTGRTQSSEGEVDESIESVALAGAEAIQRIISDRDNLRSCTSAQQRDLVALNSLNEELRRRLALIRHHYVELATRILAQLEQFDQATRSALRDQNTPNAANDDANLLALAHRLKPSNGTVRPADGGESLER
jgi:hypothetical protein